MPYVASAEWEPIIDLRIIIVWNFWSEWNNISNT